MERIPEPELMTDNQQALAYAEADFEDPHSHFIQLLRQSLPHLPESGVALDLGCGPADITLRFARAFPDWRVDGVDGSGAMLRYGDEALAKTDLQDRVTLIETYLPDGNAPRDRYDLILSNSLLHHLKDPAVLWASVNRWTQVGASVFVMDLMRPQSRTVAEKLVAHYAAGEPDVLKRDFFNSLLAAYSIDEVKAQLTQADLGHLNLESVSDRHFIVWGQR